MTMDEIIEVAEMLGVSETEKDSQSFEADKLFYEAILAVQEWGYKNDLRLFGITLSPMNEDEAGYMQEYARAYFIDPKYKNMTFIRFDIKVASGNKALISKSKEPPGFKYPIRFARTRNFKNDYITPVSPLYWVLVDRGIILPFRSVMRKGWRALPFEDMGDMKPTEI